MKTLKAKANFLAAKQDLSPRTLDQYHHALDFLEAQCPKMPRKPDAIRRALNQAPTIWVKDAWWRVWGAFFHWCAREYGTPNPMERVDRPKTPEIEIRTLEPRELAMVVAAAADNTFDKAIVSLALDSGVRANEFGHLQILDVGSETIRVWGKGRKRVRVPICPETRHLLQVLIDRDGHRGPQSLLFPGHDGQPLSRFSVYRIVRGCVDQAGIAGPKRGPHLLRHSLGTTYIANGGNPFTLQKLMRHRSITTTQQYVHLAMHTVIEHHYLYSPLRDAIRGAQGVLIRREVEEILEGV